MKKMIIPEQYVSRGGFVADTKITLTIQMPPFHEGKDSFRSVETLVETFTDSNTYDRETCIHLPDWFKHERYGELFVDFDEDAEHSPISELVFRVCPSEHFLFTPLQVKEFRVDD